MSELAAQFDGGATTGPDPVAVTSVESVLVGPLDVQAYDRYTVYLQNVGGGGGNSVSVAKVQASPVEEGGPWIDAGDVIVAPLVAGSSVATSFSGRSHKYVQVVANCLAVQTTTARVWFCAGGYE